MYQHLPATMRGFQVEREEKAVKPEPGMVALKSQGWGTKLLESF